ncbi:hypothetical protein Dimus_036049 [Dionaea muscipula]
MDRNSRERESRERGYTARKDGGWVPVLRKKSQSFTVRNHGRKEGLVSIFVDDLPDPMGPAELQRMFAKFGVVMDVFSQERGARRGEVVEIEEDTAKNARFDVGKVKVYTRNMSVINQEMNLMVGVKLFVIRIAEEQAVFICNSDFGCGRIRHGKDVEASQPSVMAKMTMKWRGLETPPHRGRGHELIHNEEDRAAIQLPEASSQARAGHDFFLDYGPNCASGPIYEQRVGFSGPRDPSGDVRKFVVGKFDRAAHHKSDSEIDDGFTLDNITSTAPELHGKRARADGRTDRSSGGSSGQRELEGAVNAASGRDMNDCGLHEQEESTRLIGWTGPFSAGVSRGSLRLPYTVKVTSRGDSTTFSIRDSADLVAGEEGSRCGCECILIRGVVSGAFFINYTRNVVPRFLAIRLDFYAVRSGIVLDIGVHAFSFLCYGIRLKFGVSCRFMTLMRMLGTLKDPKA